MKRVAMFCIPAHGHTNPMIPVCQALIEHGHQVRFYSFSPFEEKIKATGATFVPCDEYLKALSQEEQARLMNVNLTEMTIQDIDTTRAMNSFLDEEYASFKPDVVYSDSVCFWGKLSAWKHGVPLVVSTSTIAFNQMSSQYMKYSAKELAGMTFGLPKISKALKSLEPLGYHVKSALKLVQSDNQTDSIVYTSRAFQPYAESFSAHYAFVGPSLLTRDAPDKRHERKRVYIALGTVINDRPDFYKKCIEALKGMDIDVTISYGSYMKPEALGALPDNVKAYPYVNQLEVLKGADAFITHCGMNSVSESLYMAAPMVLYPQTGEQQAVARRVTEVGAGLMLTDDSVEGIRSAVRAILDEPAYARSAKAVSDDFRACSGPDGAARFIETAPHTDDRPDLLTEVNKRAGLFRLIYWLVAAAILVGYGFLFGWRFAWIIGVVAGSFSNPAAQWYQKKVWGPLKTH